MSPKYNQEKNQEDGTLLKFKWLSFTNDITHTQAPQGDTGWQSIPG